MDAPKKYSGLSNLTIHCGDAGNLAEYPAETFDVIVGQAALHHLAGNLKGTAAEFRRLLKPGEKLIFIFEPLGHNPVVAAIRAIHNCRTQWVDEANLYEWILREYGQGFTRHEVYYFGLLAYFCKASPKQSRAGKRVYRALHSADQLLMTRWPGIRRQAANVNVC